LRKKWDWIDRDYKLTKGDWRNSHLLFAEKNFSRVLSIVEKLKELARKRKVPLAHLAMRWILRNPIIPSAITGAKYPDEVEKNVQAVGWELTQEELARIDKLTSGFHL
jgi:aryl-alcohol dehydrogenase-like predicted oxidoreductase